MIPNLRALRALAIPALILVPASGALAKVSVVTTTTDLRAIAQAVGGANVDVTSIAAGNQDPHFVDAKPSFLVKLGKADLFVAVGMELETGWAPGLLTNARNAKIQPGNPGYVDASEGIAKLQVPTAADRTMGDIHPYGNPHYWLDPGNGKIIAKNIAEGLKRVDGAHAADYDANLAAFGAKLDEGLKRWAAAAAPLKDVPVIAYHNSWPYFEQRFGFKIAGFVEPKPGIPPSGKYLADLMATMKSQGIHLILMSPFYDAKTADLVAKETGASVVTLAPSVDGIAGTEDFIKLFDVDMKLLVDAVAVRPGVVPGRS
ncbi:MAG: metal ABC transporter substrate-binding protein [Acidobacteriota bacterium]